MNGFRLKLHYCTSGLIRSRAESTSYKDTTSPILIIIIIIIGYHLHGGYLQLIHICLTQTMCLWYIMLQLCCGYSMWYMSCSFPCQTFCSFTLVLPEICAQCPIWLFSVAPSSHVFQLNDFETFPVASIYYQHHMHCTSIVRSSYFKIFSVSFFVTISSPETLVPIKTRYFLFITVYDARFIVRNNYVDDDDYYYYYYYYYYFGANMNSFLL